MERILVPYDFSDVAKNALNLATEIAEQVKDSTITIVHVIEHPTPETLKTMGVSDLDPMEELYINKLFKIVEEKLEMVIADSIYAGVDLKYKIVIGQPFKEISDMITTERVQLVVMGTNGSDGLEEFLVGSNAERMVRFSKCPVLTVQKEFHIADINNIVFASNFVDVPPAFIFKLKELQKAFDAHLKIVKINTPASFTTTRHDKQQIEDFINEFDLQNCSYEIYNHTNEEDGIVAYTEDVNADLIAIGTKQRRAIGHFFSGSIAEDVVNHAKVPVWTFGLEKAL
ncbi:MAG: universal stress protein [Bacteroidota bacterium]